MVSRIEGSILYCDIMKKNIGIFIFSVVFLLSCYEEIPYDKTVIKPKLVIYSAITRDSIISVQISRTKFIGDTSNVYLNDAKVDLYINNEYKERLVLDSAGIYKSTIKAQQGNLYKIEVMCPGFRTITASTYIPDKVQIDTCIFDYNFGVDQIGNNVSRLSLTITDIQDQHNYYYIPGIFDENGNRLMSETVDPIILSEKQSFADYIFTDNLFQNSKHTFSFTIGQMYKDTVILSIEIQVVTEEFYKYFNTLADYKTTYINNNYFNSNTEPPELYSNVNNGYGIFYGYNQSSYKLMYIKNKNK